MKRNKRIKSLLKEKTTPYLEKIIRQGSKATEHQFREVAYYGLERFEREDPLGEEEKYSPSKGIVHKYSNRVLWKVSYRCAAHCQFCTRVRQIGRPEGDLSDGDIQRALLYIENHKEIDDVILSGGDPFFTPQVTMKIIDGLLGISSVKMIRISTRLPVHSPGSFKSKPIKQLMVKIAQIAKTRPFIVLVHINHPDELGSEVSEAISTLRNTGAILMTQTVFLSGINDDTEVLAKLFTLVYHLGMIPYYIYHCDSVKGLERFIVPIEKERRIVTDLRKRLSGIAVPRYVIDVPGKGKIDIPLGFWGEMDLKSCSDYEGASIKLKNL